MESINHSFWLYIVTFFLIILGRYFLIAGGTYLLLYLPLGRSLVKPTIENVSASWQTVKNDIKLSLISTGIFAIAAAFIWSSYNSGLTRLYNHLDLNNLWYLGFSYITVLILQDTYFYFTHRLFHHPSFFRWWHEGHHRSRQPTPLTSFAFDPLEAISQSLFLIAIVFIIPLHLVTLIAVLTTMTIWAAVNHIGVEGLPGSFSPHWFGKWFIGPAHHGLHHLKYTVHFGLYFTFWDKVFRT
ncbi:MAG: hypothetical protein N5P05_003266 [Chroococcopsis gigantea SAG 12.99]|jgi:lathosterol oxidase|nr:sterol desaturase family protein [Chlorogloea purpurea SAG 13.99]MDV3001660.1 hypothetical protein [Chroococcopsis gigantea SAG 12.99]